MTRIDGAAFWSASLTSLTIPSSVVNVADYVCRSCTKLETVRYEGSVIGKYMFVGCTALTGFTIANTVTSIGDQCFNYCSNLETINYEGSLENWAAVTKGINWDGKIGQSIAISGLTKIQCLDGYLECDAENREWVEVRE